MFTKWVWPVATAAGAVAMAAVLSPVPHSGAAPACDSAAISAAWGSPLQVVRCHDGWAYVSNGEMGDSTMLMRWDGSGWRHYTGFPSNKCRAAAAADGVPASELSSFSPCR